MPASPRASPIPAHRGRCSWSTKSACPTKFAPLCTTGDASRAPRSGHAHMTGAPAFTLLHVGSGFAKHGIAMLHNAGRANTPISHSARRLLSPAQLSGTRTHQRSREPISLAPCRIGRRRRGAPRRGGIGRASGEARKDRATMVADRVTITGKTPIRRRPLRRWRRGPRSPRRQSRMPRRCSARGKKRPGSFSATSPGTGRRWRPRTHRRQDQRPPPSVRDVPVVPHVARRRASARGFDPLRVRNLRENYWRASSS